MFTYKSSCLLQTYWHLRTKEKLYWADSSFETCGVINCGSGWISEGCCKPVLGVCCNPCKTKISSSSSRLVYFSLLFTVFLVRLSGPAFLASACSRVKQNWLVTRRRTALCCNWTTLRANSAGHIGIQTGTQTHTHPTWSASLLLTDSKFEMPPSSVTGSNRFSQIRLRPVATSPGLYEFRMSWGHYDYSVLTNIV